MKKRGDKTHAHMQKILAFTIGYEIYAKVSRLLRESSESSENYVKLVKIT